MDARAIGFLEVMITLAVVGVLSFLVYLVNQQGRRAAGTPAEAPSGGGGPRWYEFALATILLALAAAVLLWQLYPPESGAGTGGDWRGGARAQIFFAVMALVGVLALAVFLIVTLSRGRRAPPRPAVEVAADDPPVAAAGHESPVVARGLALLVLAFGFLLVNWLWVERAVQYDMMRHLVYPAVAALMLVLLWDKATRGWNEGSGAESFREWLFCDAFALLLVLGYLNLRGWDKADGYAALFWDLLALVLLLAVFWVVDRSRTRIRFLLAHAAIALLPVLLLIWRFVHEVAAPEEISWWSTIWPFLILSLVFFVLEIIAVVASAGRGLLPALKDLLFVVLYAVLLIVAIPAAA